MNEISMSLYSRLYLTFRRCVYIVLAMKNKDILTIKFWVSSAFCSKAYVASIYS